jgi:RND family efflux transporter MFP subunit
MTRIGFFCILTFFAFTTSFLTTGCHRHSATKEAGKQLWTCGMHPNYISDRAGNCPICGMKLVPKRQETGSGAAEEPGIKIDPATLQNIGVVTETVRTRNLTKTIRTSATVAVDERRIFTVNAKVMGWAEKLYADFTYQKVEPGQPLLSIYSPELVAAQEEYLQALAGVKKLAPGGSPELKDQANQMLASTRRKFQYWDIPESELQRVEAAGVPQKALSLFAPAGGVVLEKMVVQGQQIMPGMPLYKIADLSLVWIMADVYQEDLSFVKIGQEAGVELSYFPGRPFKGMVAYIPPLLESASRTASIRVEVRNTPGLELKPGMFATVSIQSPAAVDALAVPEQAVIRSGTRNIVVLSLGNGRFLPKEVRLGLSAGGYVQVLEGLAVNDLIVTSSQFLIDSESNLKAAVQQLTGPATASPAPVPELKPAAPAAAPHAKAIYTCPMHPKVISDKPGICPICEMDLVLEKKK